MTITTQRFSPTWAGVRPAQNAGLDRLLALLFVLMSLGIPAAGLADIYQWTDQRGGKVLSNVPPTKNDKARDVKLFVKETQPAAATVPTASSGPMTASTKRTPTSESNPAAATKSAASSEPVAPPARQELKNAATSGEETDESVPRRSRRPRSSR